ncbi:MAG TPA: hypothetical protein VM008_01305 [Phycisphaerae bacterium]|nr:hypothetical protein [Phycisphaerae bacterium]
MSVSPVSANASAYQALHTAAAAVKPQTVASDPDHDGDVDGPASSESSEKTAKSSGLDTTA